MYVIVIITGHVTFVPAVDWFKHRISILNCDSQLALITGEFTITITISLRLSLSV